MEILIFMLIGVLIGRFCFPKKLKKLNEKMQVVMTMLLIFAMGVMLGRRENLINELSSLGFKSLVFCLIPTILSTIIVYFLTERFFDRDKKEDK